jgi:hypothetical protein
MLHLLSFVVLCLIAAGVWCRHRRPGLHIRLMIAAFVCDVLLVVYIEATRHAVERVARATAPMIWFHATVSVLVLAAYVAQLALGRRVLAGAHTSRRMHVAVGVTFVSLRLANYVTSFLV